jgi:hypothetical protein
MSIHHLTSKDEKSKLPVFVSELHKVNDLVGFDSLLEDARLSNAVAMDNITEVNHHYSITYTEEYKITDYWAQFSCDFTASNQIFSIDLDTLESSEVLLFTYVHKDRTESNDEYQGYTQVIDSDTIRLVVDANASLPQSLGGKFTFHLKTLKPLSV